jgi:LysR family glycine cleavage system transcriptional activator
LKGRKPLRSPRDIKHHTLLHVNDTAEWGRWLGSVGVDDGACKKRGTIVNQASMAIDAAVDGQGIALARTALASWDLISGRLVRPFQQALAAPYAFWIVCPKSAATQPKIASFREWLLEEAGKDTQRVARLGSASRLRRVVDGQIRLKEDKA